MLESLGLVLLRAAAWCLLRARPVQRDALGFELMGGDLLTDWAAVLGVERERDAALRARLRDMLRRDPSSEGAARA